MSHRLRRSIQITLSLLVIAVPLFTGLSFLTHAGVRDHLDVFAAFLVSPTSLVLPLIAVVVSCLSLYSELGDRFIANTRARVSIRERLLVMLISAVGWSFALFFLYAFIPFVIAFLIWPAVGDPSIDPAGYHMTPEQAHIDALTRNSYSFLLSGGDLAYGLIYSVWVGLCGAVFAGLGFGLLLIVSNRILALAIPFVIYVGGTLGAAVIGTPSLGFLYSIFPAGIQPVQPLAAIAPMVALGVVAIVVLAPAIARSPTNARLS